MFNVDRSQSFNVKCLQKSKRKKILPPDARLPAFLTCLANLMTAHLQELAVQSIADFRKYVKILEEDSKGSHRPGFILNLKVPHPKLIIRDIFHKSSEGVCKQKNKQTNKHQISQGVCKQNQLHSHLLRRGSEHRGGGDKILYQFYINCHDRCTQ